MPPPAEASTTSFARLLLRLRHLLLHLLRLLHQLVHVASAIGSSTSCASKVSLTAEISVLLGERLLLGSPCRLRRLAERERDREPAAGHLVERLAERRRRSSAPRPAGGGSRPRPGTRASACRRRAPTGAPRASSDGAGIERCSHGGTTLRCQASWSCSSSSGGASARARPRRRAGATASGGGASARAAGAGRRRQRSRRAAAVHGAPRAARAGRRATRARGRPRPRHLDERELEREPRVAALAHVVDGDGEQVDSRSTVACGELVRLLAQPLARLLGHRQRLGHLAHVLDEQQVPEMLEQVGDEAAEILALLGELLDEDERARRCRGRRSRSQSRKSASSSTAPSSWSTAWTRDLAARSPPRAGRASTRRRGSEPRAPRAISARAASGASIALAVGDPAQHLDELRQARPRNTNVWQRERTVGSTFARSVVQKTKTRCGGGSSISFSSAFQAASVSWCASSRM